MPSEGENDHEKPTIGLCKRKGIRGYDADPDVRRRGCAISGNNTLGSVTGLSERLCPEILHACFAKKQMIRFALPRTSTSISTIVP